MIHSCGRVVIATGGHAGAPAMRVYNTIALKGGKKEGDAFKKHFGLPESFIQLQGLVKRPSISLKKYID